ncbi:MAG: AAA family ATPase [Oscillospiraceae bacterium]|jgi:hypothetical protein|nr:AAA family ATPase [Oscillospiraceae bacterium]
MTANNYSKVPAELKALPNWVCWKAEKAGDRITKRPYNANTGALACSNNPATWASLENALRASSHYSGIGFMFSKDTGLVGVDLDHCRDKDSGEITSSLAREMIRSFHSYTEVSPSGTGIHIICRGRLPGPGLHRDKVEMYDSGRYFTVTGNQYSPDSLVDAQSAINQYYSKFTEGCKKAAAAPQTSTGEGLQDEEVISRARKSRQAEAFERLWHGDIKGYPSQSEADLALCNMLAFWTGCNADQMDRLFRQSGLMRQKWDRKQAGTTYGAITVQNAVEHCPRTYTGHTTAERDFYGVKIGTSEKKDDVFGRSATKPEKLPTFSAAELQNKELPPLKFIVDGVLPQGLALLASPPKYGKSWLVLDLCLSVAAGKPFLGRGTQKTGCLYLALEDSARRLQDRMNKILVGGKAPDGCRFLLSAPDLGNGLIEALDNYVSEKPQTGLIVIDTLQKIRAPANGKESAYGADYREVGALKKFADKHGICVLLVHHLRKMVDDLDPFNMISGTNGLMGAADTSFVMTRKARADRETKLSYTGRDIDQNEVVMQFNKADYRWHILGNAEEIEAKQAAEKYEQDPIVFTIKKLLKQSPAGWNGTMSDLLEAGKHFAGVYLAGSPRDLANKVKALTPVLWNHDRIVHERAKNGGGSGKHHFYIATVTFKHPPLVTVDGKSTGGEHENPKIIPFS